jgi:hypothetical protein
VSLGVALRGCRELQSPKAWPPSSPLSKGGLYGSCLHSLQAGHLVGPSWEARERRMAAYPALPEACTTNRPAAARRAVVARGDKTARTVMAVMTTQPRRCCCGYLYSDREGYYCPKGNRLLCEECATRGAGVCPTHKSLVHGEKRLTAPRTGIALGPMTGRAAKRVRKVLGPRLRALRKQRALSQERLGKEIRAQREVHRRGRARGEVDLPQQSLPRGGRAWGSPTRPHRHRRQAHRVDRRGREDLRARLEVAPSGGRSKGLQRPARDVQPRLVNSLSPRRRPCLPAWARPPRRADLRSSPFLRHDGFAAREIVEQHRWVLDRVIVRHPVDLPPPEYRPGVPPVLRASSIPRSARGRESRRRLDNVGERRESVSVSGIGLSGEVVNAPGTCHWRAVRRPR